MYIQNKSGVEYANILRVMAGLNEEIKVLRERVAAAATENDQLRQARDELLAANETKEEVTPAPEPEDAASYRATIADLQVNKCLQCNRSFIILSYPRNTFLKILNVFIDEL